MHVTCCLPAVDSQYKDLNDFDKTHKIFLEAFTESFPWEVIKVLAGPPEVVVTWRHWAPFSGTFKDKRGDGRLVEMYGMLKATVDDDLKITKLEVFFDPETFLKVKFVSRPDFFLLPRQARKCLGRPN